MQRVLCLSLGAALGLSSLTAVIAPVHADPAYSANKLISIFKKDKAAIEASKAGGTTRHVCLDTDPDCKASQPPSPTKVDLLVNFEFDSDRLTPAAKENLNQFAAALKDPDIKGTKFEIDGHTDATGAEQYNLTLSERRAEAVVGYLVSLGVDGSTLEAKGFGKSKPRVADPYSGENRRVETHLTE